MDKDIFDNAKNGNVKFFEEVPLDVLCNARDEQDDSFLSKAVMYNHLDCVKLIYERCPSLLYSQTFREGWHAMHHAAARDNPEILKFLIDVDAKTHIVQDTSESSRGDQKQITTKKLIRIPDGQGRTALFIAVWNLKHESVKLLNAADDPDFPHFNLRNQTPLMLCMTDSKYSEMFKLLLEIRPSQCKVRIPHNGRAALHHAATIAALSSIREPDAIAALSSIREIIRLFPDCSEMVDYDGQNFVHLVASGGHIEVMKFILAIQEIDPSVLNRQDSKGHTPLDIAALKGDERMTLCLLNDPRVSKSKTSTKTSLHLALKMNNFEILQFLIRTNPNLFEGVGLDVILAAAGDTYDSILSKAVLENNLYCCKALAEGCPSLLYHQNQDGCTALHHAASIGDPKMVSFLIRAGAKTDAEDEVVDIETGEGNKLPNRKLLTMVDKKGDTALHKAVLNHKLEAVKLLIEAEPHFDYPANISDQTPLLITIQDDSHGKKGVVGDIRKLLLQMNPGQCRVRIGENGWTPLHHATVKNDISAIEDIIHFCPDCLEVVDNDGRNFLHLAVERQHIQVVKHILGRKDIPGSVLNGQDKNGNTPLHTAALNGNESIAICLLYDPKVDATTTNKNGQHVLHAINFEYDARKAGVLGVLDRLGQKDLKEQSDFDLVVGALIATVSFTAGITVPGGYISDEGPNQGTAVLSKKLSFTAFVISNNFGLLLSLYAVFSHFCARRLIQPKDINYRLKVATFCTLGALFAMMIAFITGSFAVLPDSDWLAILVCVNSCLFFIFACRPMWRIAMQRWRFTS